MNVRPEFSSINYCNDFYTAVGFSCGGPCYLIVFVFTDENRPTEQYGMVQRADGNENIITYSNDEKGTKLYIRNLLTGKEISIQNPDIHWTNYGLMLSSKIVEDNLLVEYIIDDKKIRKKAISLKKILN